MNFKYQICIYISVIIVTGDEVYFTHFNMLTLSAYPVSLEREWNMTTQFAASCKQDKWDLDCLEVLDLRTGAV